MGVFVWVRVGAGVGVSVGVCGLKMYMNSKFTTAPAIGSPIPKSI